MTKSLKISSKIFFQKNQYFQFFDPRKLAGRVAAKREYIFWRTPSVPGSSLLHPSGGLRPPAPPDARDTAIRLGMDFSIEYDR